MRGVGLLGCPRAAGCCWQEGSGPVAMPLGDCGWTVFLLGAQWLGCLPAGRDACPLLKAPREAQSPFHLLLCWPLPLAGVAAGTCPAGTKVGSSPGPARREGAPPVLRPGLCPGEGCVAGLPRLPGRTAAPQPDCWHSSRRSLSLCGWPHAAASLHPAGGGEWDPPGDLSWAGGTSLPQGIAHP